MKYTIDGLVNHLMDSGFVLPEAVEMIERTWITQALERTNGNRSAASKLLHIHRNTLQKKMKDLKMESPKAARKPPQRVKNARRPRTASAS